jgi:hypothetical protein
MTLVALVLLLASAAAQAAAPPPQTPSPQDLYLRVSTHSGALPLELNLDAELKGVDIDTVKNCSIRVDRTYTMPSGMKLDERKEHPCVAEPEALLSAKFKRSLILTEPGDYLLRIMLEPKEGKTIAGMTHPVKVYKAPWQVGVAGTTTD